MVRTKAQKIKAANKEIAKAERVIRGAEKDIFNAKQFIKAQKAAMKKF